MPDWSYGTVFRPLLFRLPFPFARDFCLGFMGRLASLPLGGAVIDFLGHMRPDPRLRTDLAGLQLSSPVVLGPWLDTNLLAPAALSRFGFGMIEVAPLGAGQPDAVRSITRDDDRQCLCIPALPPHTSAATTAVPRLSRTKLAAPLMVRLMTSRGSPYEVRKLLPLNASALSLVTLEQAIAESWPLDEWRQHVDSVTHAGCESTMPAQPIFLVLPADFEFARRQPYLRTGLEAGVSGFIVDGRIANPAGGWLVGRAAWDSAIATVRSLRSDLSQTIPIIAGSAVDPESALQLMTAGATAVQIDAGLVFSGPGLPKRINDAVLFARDSVSPSESTSQPAPHAAAMSWFWALALGIAMLFGGTLAMAIACTRVVLPYDEAYLGMTAPELITKVNPRLIAFMAHDRVTLAGTMLAVGIQYVFLAWFGIRRGQHWAKMTVLLSAFAGFGSFFLFLGFGYFDPFHAFVTAILFQFLLLAFQGRLDAAAAPPYPSLQDDWRWRLAQWGQLFLIVEAVAVISAGATISIIGSTSVFVPEDLEFMQTTAEALRTANPRLIPVVAHDRASFGGMLMAIGIATLLPALWGIRQGETWIAWMLGLAGTIGYCATLAVHFHVGYTDLHHLLPALGGLALLWLALALLIPLLQPAPEDHRTRWNSILAEWNQAANPLRPLPGRLQ